MKYKSFFFTPGTVTNEPKRGGKHWIRILAVIWGCLSFVACPGLENKDSTQKTDQFKTAIANLPGIEVKLPASLTAGDTTGDGSRSLGDISELTSADLMPLKSPELQRMQNGGFSGFVAFLVEAVKNKINSLDFELGKPFNFPLDQTMTSRLPPEWVPGLNGKITLKIVGDNPKDFLLYANIQGYCDIDYNKNETIEISTERVNFSYPSRLKITENAAGTVALVLETDMLLTTEEGSYGNKIYCHIDPAKGTTESITVDGTDIHNWFFRDASSLNSEGLGSASSVLRSPNSSQTTIALGDTLKGGILKVQEFTDGSPTVRKLELYDGTGNLIYLKEQQDDVTAPLKYTLGILVPGKDPSYKPMKKEGSLETGTAVDSLYHPYNFTWTNYFYYLDKQGVGTTEYEPENDVDLSAQLTTDRIYYYGNGGMVEGRGSFFTTDKDFLKDEEIAPWAATISSEPYKILNAELEAAVLEEVNPLNYEDKVSFDLNTDSHFDDM